MATTKTVTTVEVTEIAFDTVHKIQITRTRTSGLDHFTLSISDEDRSIVQQLTVENIKDIITTLSSYVTKQ